VGPRPGQRPGRLVGGDEPDEVQFRLLGTGGATRWLSGRARVYLEDGRPVRKVGVVADVTERRHAEEALEQARGDADQANRAKSEFLSRISHELCTPLNAILGFAQLLRLEELGREQAEGVDHIVTAGQHLLGLIDEVLDISRSETGSLSRSPEPVDVLGVVRATVDLIGPLAAERDITVQAPAADDPSWTVRADHQRLKQVLLNLASKSGSPARPRPRAGWRSWSPTTATASRPTRWPGCSGRSTASGPSSPRSRAPAWGWPCPRA
jgi:signal transduction histidine kinase